MSDQHSHPQDVPPAPGPRSPLAPPPPPAAPVDDQKTLAVMAHVLGLLTGWVGPLILYLVATDKPLAKVNAQEALNFQITLAIAWTAAAVLWTVTWLLSLILIGLVLMPLAMLVSLALVIGDLVYCLLGAAAANRGEEYRYPVAIRLLK